MWQYSLFNLWCGPPDWGIHGGEMEKEPATCRRDRYMLYNHLLFWELTKISRPALVFSKGGAP
jgi:hypothetical protein